MFKKIERSLALQFTGFVFLLLMINGAMFLIVDFGNQIRQIHARLQNQMSLIQTALPDIFMGRTDELFLSHIERLRVVSEDGEPIFSGELYEDIPFLQTEGFSTAVIGQEQFTLLTEAMVENGEVVGYVQIAEPEFAAMRNLRLRLLLYMLVSVLVSLLTYLFGRRFAKKSLRPAEAMLIRLEQFTQDASHELRTPLAVLGSSLDLALKTKRYEEGILSAKEDLKQISDLVQRLLELARAGHFALSRSDLDLSSLVTDSLTKFTSLAKTASITLRSKIEPHVKVNADNVLLHQVLSNLLSNAIKFTKAGGTVEVTLTRQSLTVSDTGIGISAEHLPHIYERFYRADSSRSTRGFGLGLSFVKQILSMHGWMISVESKEGEGTTFTILFDSEKHRNS